MTKSSWIYLIGFVIIIFSIRFYYKTKLNSNPKCTKAIAKNWHPIEGGVSVDCEYVLKGKKITVSTPFSTVPKINDTFILKFSLDNPTFTEVYENCNMDVNFGDYKECDCD